MIRSGLCSISFRQLSPCQVVELVQQAGLDAIEWGGDVHVPPGDMATAFEVHRLTSDAGVEVSSYGSYYRVLDEKGRVQDFSPVLESAQALGTDTIRIWAGRIGSDAVTPAYGDRLVDECHRITQQAAEANMRIAFEFHHRTLTDNNAAAVELLHRVNHPNLYIYWQPMYWLPDLQMHLQGIEMLKERLLNLHVFQWQFDAGISDWIAAIDRRPLEEGADVWTQYLSVPLPARRRYALLEFVRGDSPEQFLADAAVLKTLLKKAGRPFAERVHEEYSVLGK